MVALASGGALVADALLGLPVPAVWLAAVGAGVVAAVGAARGRSAIAAAGRLRAGVVAGGAALVAYDASRLVLVAVGGLSVHPFDALPHLGTALVGGQAPAAAALAAGAAFHVVNAVGFSVAYVLLLGERGVWAGIGWGLALEAVMLAVYPFWLQVTALGEFASMSLVGHVCYGATLGAVARRLVVPGRVVAP